MGKRKMHTTTIYQCDWTGMPMKGPGAYIPLEVDGKVSKKGNYCTWECAVAAHTATTEGNSDEKVLKRIKQITGGEIVPAPSYEQLKWFGGDMTIETFCQASVDKGNVDCVLIGIDGTLSTISVKREEFKDNCMSHFPVDGPSPVRFHTLRKRTKANRETWVYHTPTCYHERNSSASQYFKMDLHGPVIVAQCTIGSDLIGRWVDFTVSNFEAQYTLKRPRKDSAAMSETSYAKARKEMQASLNAVEERASSLAARPEEVMQASVIPQATAAEMSRLVDPDGSARLAMALGSESRKPIECA